MTKAEFDRRLAELYKDDVDTSPDFQCDQTGGFPTSLCVNWDKGKAWLELNQAMINDGDDVSPYEQMCVDYGIRFPPVGGTLRGSRPRRGHRA